MSILTLDDAVTEPTETIRVYVSGPLNADLAGSGEFVVLVDDDEPPGISIGDASTTEGGTVTLTLLMNKPSATPVDVNWATQDDVADLAS